MSEQSSKNYELLKENILPESKAKSFKYFFILTSSHGLMLSERKHYKDNIGLLFSFYFFFVCLFVCDEENLYSRVIGLFFFFFML